MTFRFSLFTFLLFLLLLSSCTHDDDEAVVERGLQLSAESFVWDSQTRSQELTINTPRSWTVTSNVPWCQPLKSNGMGKTPLRLWVNPNITAEERSGQLTVTAGNEQKTVSLQQPALASADNYHYVLPVVYHVLFQNANDTTQNIREGWLAKVTDGVNALYRQAHANVQFEMAPYSDDGNQLDEPGVVRHRVDFSDYDAMRFLDTAESDNRQFADYAFNIQRTINIYVFRFADDSELGLSDLAIVPSHHPLDSLMTLDWLNDKTTLSFPYGCCINSKYIYEKNERGMHNSLNSVATVAHELGHYLGLLHTFSQNSCEEDDACTDTHVCDYNAYLEEVSELIKRIQDEGRTPRLDEVAKRTDCTDGSTYVADNIMDYAYCYSTEFSPQQRTRMKHVLNYAPSVPGPKLDTYPAASTRTTLLPAEFRPRIVVCPAVPQLNRLP